NTTSGTSNTSVGFNALFTNNTGSTNAAFGNSALYSNTTGFSNVAIGNLSLYSNTIRPNLVAVGDSALYKNGIGVTQFYEAVANTGIGSKALANNTVGYQNTGLGAGALFKNDVGYHNTGLGSGALFNNSSGTLNTAVGSRSLLANTSGVENTAMGYSVMQLNGSGNRNVAIGKEASYSNVSGNNNVSLGYEAGRTATGSGNVFLGYKAGRNETGDNKLYIANSEADPTQALIYGDFFNKSVTMNGVLEVDHTQTTQDAISGIKMYPPGFCLSSAGVYGQNNVDDGCGTGVRGQGGQYGILGECYGTGSAEYAALFGQANGTNTGVNFGMRSKANNASANYGGYGEAISIGAGVNLNFGFKGIASGAISQNLGMVGVAQGNVGSKYGGSFSAMGTGDNYGLIASASGGTNNYAAWFNTGSVWIANNMGVGQAPNIYQLAIKHSSYGLQIQNSAAGSSYWELWQSGAANGVLNFYNSIGNMANINYTTGVYSSTSDRRLKENIQPIGSVLSNVMKLEAKSYSYIADTEHKLCIGFIAQDVEPIFPQLVTPPSTTGGREINYTMNYAGFGVLAIEAIQEQQKIIDAQEVRIAKLEEAVAELLTRAQVSGKE
ncbi:MAG: tail fiber domain-containing protein, partial [Saprospiraceae bacterium]